LRTNDCAVPRGATVAVLGYCGRARVGIAAERPADRLRRCLSGFEGIDI